MCSVASDLRSSTTSEPWNSRAAFNRQGLSGSVVRWFSGSHFRILRLVELHFEPAGHHQVRDESVAVILDRLGELHAARLELAHRGLQVVAVERDVGGA